MVFSSLKDEPAIKSPQSLPPSTGLSVKQSTERLLPSGHNNEVAVLLEEHKLLRRQMIPEAKPYVSGHGNQEEDEVYNNAMTERDDYSVSESRDLMQSQVRKQQIPISGMKTPSIS
jgi:hypothetical protein